MRPPPVPIVLDNTVLSSFQEAESLPRILSLWPGRWVITLQVRAEAANWKAHGHRVVNFLDQLEANQEIHYVSPEPGTEGTLFAQLQRVRGVGESASIAVAFVRAYIFATDDRRAMRSCQSLSPPVPTITTEGLLSTAVADGLLTEPEAHAIWVATGIRDPNRHLELDV
jgi:predicted nucleic acid-binding protein